MATLTRHNGNESDDSNNVNGIRKLVSKQVQQMVQFSVQSISNGGNKKTNRNDKFLQ